MIQVSKKAMDFRFGFVTLAMLNIGFLAGIFFEKWSQLQGHSIKPKTITDLDLNRKQAKRIDLNTVIVINNNNEKHQQISPKRGEEEPRRVFLFRHGERVDFTFGLNWTAAHFDDTGNYRPTDMNMPRSPLPVRQGGDLAFVGDAPLTEIGVYQADIAGKNLKTAGVKIHHIYSAPPLRYIQTASGILKGLGAEKSVKIRIEPGLYEWLGWINPNNWQPDWMSTEELSLAGYNVDSGYRPIVSLTDLQSRIPTEAPDSDVYYQRGFDVTSQAIDKTKVGNLLFVGHAASLDTCSRQLTGQVPLTLKNMKRQMRTVPFLGLAMLEQDINNKTWSLKDPPVYPLTHWGSHTKRKPIDS